MNESTGCGCGNGNGKGAGLGRLVSPARNRYYYGKLLDAYHFDLEQDYGNRKRWLLNRLSLGTGVLCGLRVVAVADWRRIRLRPGVAVDGLGREIIVPIATPPVDPMQPTDDCGRPEGPPLMRGGIVTVYLCYHECPTDPAPALTDPCAPERECEYGTIEERYRIQIRPGRPEPDILIPDDACRRIFAQKPARSLTLLETARLALREGDPDALLEELNTLRARRGTEPIEALDTAELREAAFGEERDYWLRASTRRGLLCELFGGVCPTPDDPCVPLATVTLDPRGGITGIDNCSVRRVIYSNAFLLELILCLGTRVDECCDEPTVRALEIVSGDNQVGRVSEPLADPLVVRVTESGSPVNNENVVFEVFGGGAIGDDPTALGPTFAVATRNDGTATLPVWRLGPAPGAQAVMARIAAGMPAQVTFRATARARETLPVVRAIWPANAARLAREGEFAEWFAHFQRLPRIELTFDRRMDETQLSNPDPWLGVYLVRLRGDGSDAVTVQRLGLQHQAPPVPGGMLGAAGITEAYRIVEAQGPDRTRTSMAMLMRAAGIPEGAVGEPAAATAAAAMVATTAVARHQLRVVTLIRAAGGNITAAAAPGPTLDAEFEGTLLDAASLDALGAMAVGETRAFGEAFWDALVPVPGAVLPESGDGTEGGRFHARFEFVPG